MVYVDNMNIKFRNMIMCHMAADTSYELIEFAKKLGLNIKHIQEKGAIKEHFDISLSIKKKALKLGATEIGFRQFAKIINERDYEYYYTNNSQQ